MEKYSKLKLSKIKQSQGFEYRLVDSGGRAKVFWLKSGDQAYVTVPDLKLEFHIPWKDDEDELFGDVFMLLICSMGKIERKIYHLKRQVGEFFYRRNIS